MLRFFSFIFVYKVTFNETFCSFQKDISNSIEINSAYLNNINKRDVDYLNNFVFLEMIANLKHNCHSQYFFIEETHEISVNSTG